jgi:hypothetical protein
MAAPNAIFCTDNSETSIDFSGQSIISGSFITATLNTDPDPILNVYECFEVYGSDQPASSYTATTNTYTSCYDCFVNNYTSVRLSPCDETLGLPSSVDIGIAQFGFIPNENQVFYLQFTNPIGFSVEGTFVGCFRVESVAQSSESDYSSLELSTIDQIIHNNYSIENGCNECLNGFSAGTESTICVVCCPCTTGETVTSVSAPHPTWTNGQGQAIVQLNAITLGGPNGLNN